jgi:plastocyanin
VRRALLIALAAALLLAAPAPATSVKVSLGRDGFSPSHVTIVAGDSISWVSTGDGHRISCTTCRFKSNALEKDDTYGFTFLHPGTFVVTDVLNGNRRATVTVKKAPATVAVEAAPSTLPYGKTVTVTGAVSNRRAGQKVEILAQECIAPRVNVVATVKSKKGGAFTYTARPAQVTSFHARYAAPSGTIVSATVRIAVAPVVSLKKVAPGKFSIRVVAAKAFVGKAVMFQRFAAKQHRWVTSKVVVLDRQNPSMSPLKSSRASSTVLQTKLRKGTKVRALLRAFQALPCYATAWSRTTTA